MGLAEATKYSFTRNERDKVRSCLHGMDDELAPIIESKHDDFEKSAAGIKAEPQLPLG